MEDQHALAAHYAILIGIDAYPYPERPLKSCVRDVQDINDYLERTLDSIQIKMLTATENLDPKSSDPTEDAMLRPTYQNVISAMENMTSQAKPGDFVYIHYSGHGTRVAPDCEFSNKSTGDLALVLLNGGKENCVRYLWGSELASLLHAMIIKRLVVTLVLDCCFSASLYRRDDPSIRFLPYDLEIDSKFPLDPKKSIQDRVIGAASRDASMLPNWLINPDRYAALVACGPHELAKGLTTEDGQKHGALSYFLLRTLIEYCGLQKKHKEIYHYLCAKFRESWPQQNPLLYGNKDQGFFGHMEAEINMTLISIIEHDERLQLQAGQAHGICVGDQFALFPMDSVENDPKTQQNLMVAKVIQARGLTSDLELVDTTLIRAQTGWVAKHLTRASVQKFTIHLASSLPCQDQWMASLKERSLHFHKDEGALISFYIVLNNNQQYEILDSHAQKIANLPPLLQDDADVSYICDIIMHLARYELFKGLANKVPAVPFRESFRVQIVSRAGIESDPGRLVEVECSGKGVDVQAAN